MGLFGFLFILCLGAVLGLAGLLYLLYQGLCRCVNWNQSYLFFYKLGTYISHNYYINVPSVTRAQGVFL